MDGYPDRVCRVIYETLESEIVQLRDLDLKGTQFSAAYADFCRKVSGTGDLYDCVVGPGGLEPPTRPL